MEASLPGSGHRSPHWDETTNLSTAELVVGLLRCVLGKFCLKALFCSWRVTSMALRRGSKLAVVGPLLLGLVVGCAGPSLIYS